ncbi:MAG: energy-coupling factor ABC transporter permease [Xanthomonadales bacterium]|jgi:uncharacterized membrane protein|nr:energy-coupling factor ABC transporter permease [Xanthomonadales bacterium]
MSPDPAHLLSQAPAAWSWTTALLALPPLLVALRRAPWRSLIARAERQHAFYLSLLLLPLVWVGSLEVTRGASVHLLGITPLVLIFGWQLAVVLGALAAVVLGAFGAWAWVSLPPQFILSVLVPVAVTQGMLMAADRLPRTNLFVYLLGVGFLGGALSMTVYLLLDASWNDWSADHALVLLLAFPEGFLAGTIVTALTVFYPQIMRTYDDDRYLGPSDPGDPGDGGA